MFNLTEGREYMKKGIINILLQVTDDLPNLKIICEKLFILMKSCL